MGSRNSGYGIQCVPNCPFLIVSQEKFLKSKTQKYIGIIPIVFLDQLSNPKWSLLYDLAGTRGATACFPRMTEGIAGAVEDDRLFTYWYTVNRLQLNKPMQLRYLWYFAKYTKSTFAYHAMNLRCKYAAFSYSFDNAGYHYSHPILPVKRKHRRATSQFDVQQHHLPGKAINCAFSPRTTPILFGTRPFPKRFPRGMRHLTCVG